MARLAEVIEKSLGWIVGLLVAGAIGFVSWATIEISQRPTREETIELIGTNAPYIHDRRMILDAVTNRREDSKMLRESINNNTNAITRLEATINVLLKDKCDGQMD